MTTPAKTEPEKETKEEATPAEVSAKEAREQRIAERKNALAAQRANPLLPQSAYNVVPVKPDIRKEGFKGSYTHIPHKGDPDFEDAEWGLKIEPNHPLGRTHIAKSEDHTWQGSEAEFRQNFEKA